MANLEIDAVSLTSSKRTAPLNGPPSSSDYNESQIESLADLVSLSDIINSQIIPLLTSLSAAAGLPQNSPIGIEGSTVFSDTTDQTDTFYNASTQEPLVIADSLRVVRNMIAALQSTITDLQISVGQVQSTVSSSGQGNLSSSVRNLQNSLSTVNTTLSSISSTVNLLSSVILIDSANNVSIGQQVNAGILAVAGLSNLAGGVTVAGGLTSDTATTGNLTVTGGITAESNAVFEANITTQTLDTQVLKSQDLKVDGVYSILHTYDPQGRVWVLADSAGQPALGLYQDRTFEVQGPLVIGPIQLAAPGSLSQYRFCILDNSGNVLYGINTAGVVIQGS